MGLESRPQEDGNIVPKGTRKPSAGRREHCPQGLKDENIVLKGQTKG